MAGDTRTRQIHKAADAALWALQVAGTALFFFAGIPKLTGDDQMVQAFDMIGLGQWFRYATGLIEMVSAVLLLVPATAGIGATLTVLFVISGSPAIPIAVLIAMAIVAWDRRDNTLRLIGR